MFTKAKARSSSETSSTWSNRATALRTCCASVIGSLRCFGKAKTVSGRLLRAAELLGSSNGSHVGSRVDMFDLHDSSAAIPHGRAENLHPFGIWPEVREEIYWTMVSSDTFVSCRPK